ncbi:MAG: FAD:protein FMN transferase [Planctomycetota bacterium]
MQWLIAALIMVPAADAPPAWRRVERTERHMATDFTIVLYASAPTQDAGPATAPAPAAKANTENASGNSDADGKTVSGQAVGAQPAGAPASGEKPRFEQALDAAFARIRTLDKVLSDYDDASELSRLSAASPTAKRVPVSGDLWRALERADAMSRLTDGAFDATVGPLTRLWRRSRRQRELPSAERLAAAREAVGYQLVRLHAVEKSVELLRPNMRLDMGGIGQGLAADEALAELRRWGFPRALVNASGDIVAGEPPPDMAGWRVGIAPLDPAAPPSHFLSLKRGAVSTSGDAFQFVEIAGQRYSHIVDPRTGLGVVDRSSVSVVASDGTTADALATALCVLGPTRGLEMIDRLPDTAAIYVQADPASGATRTRPSRRWSELAPNVGPAR